MKPPHPQETSPAGTVVQRFRQRMWLHQAFALTLAITCLYFAFRKADLAQLAEVIKGASLWFILLSAVLNLATTVVKCNKVAVLVRAVRRLRFRNLFAAETVSVLVDTAFPLRLNELVTCYLLSRTEKISAGFLLGAEFVLKVLEALLLATLLIVLGIAVAFPQWVATCVWFATGAALAAFAFLVAIVSFPNLARRPVEWLSGIRMPGVKRVAGIISNVLAGVSQTAVRPSALFAVLLITIVEWSLLAGALWAAAQSVDVHLTPIQILALLTANHVAFAVPSSTSGSIGIYEVTGTTMLVLLFGMAREQALALVLIAHFVILAVGALSGLAGLQLVHLSLKEIRQEAVKMDGQPRATPAA